MQVFRFVFPNVGRPAGICLLAGAMTAACAGTAAAQGEGGPHPAAFGVQAVSAPAEQTTPVQGSSRLSGEVLDSSGALVPDARIVLQSTGEEPRQADRTVVSGKEGHFVFSEVPAGAYTVTVSAVGFEPFTSQPLRLQPGEERQMTDVTLKIPAGHADAYVTMTTHDLATVELHAAEQQRIFGFPDFYTCFVWNAAPLDARQKLSLGVHATTDRMAFVTAGLVASAEQIKGTFPGYGGGYEGFGKRYGAAYADGFVGKFLGGALLPSVFRQDPRYFYMGSNGTVKQRVRHAVLSAVLARGDNGRMQLNYSHILGNAGAGALSTLYHPASDSAGKLALDNALLGTLGEAGVNVVRELLLKRFVRGGDVDANGMP